MSFVYKPTNENDLVIPNIDKFKEFITQCITSNNYNVGIYGGESSCKTTLCNYFIHRFVQQQLQTFQSNTSKLDVQDARNKMIFIYEPDDDLNINNIQSHINIFCKKNTKYEKLIYIENFDDLSEANQQQLKIYIDNFNLLKSHHKTHFLIEVSETHKVRDIIESRIQIYDTPPLAYCHLFQITKSICKKNNLTMSDSQIDFLLNVGNINIKNVINILKKAWLLDKKCLQLQDIVQICYLIDFKDFDNYVSHIKSKSYFDAVEILYKLYHEGYDISDILYFFYQYCKSQFEIRNEQEPCNIYFDTINILCKYINEIYKGRQNVIILNYLTYDIYAKHHNVNDYSTLLK